MRCVVNPDDMYVHGNYNTGNAAAFMVVFELCDSAKLAANPATKDLKCSGREDVALWMRQKYFLTLENRKQFIAHKFDDEKISMTSETTWYAMNTLERTDHVNIYTRTNIQMDDHWFQLGSLLTH